MGNPNQEARIRDLAARAAALAGEERSAFLDGACGGDGELRSEVERVLEQQSHATVVSAVVSDGGVAEGEFAAGRRLSHYEIMGKIGEGGMGAVYRAVDVNLGRAVALKVIPGNQISAHDRQRFAREAKAASALNHPNIVTIYEYNTDGGVDFIAMELVDGEPLDRLLWKRGKGEEIALGKLLDYAGQVASALAKAHGARIVHRDLKPGNIMITRDGVAKVLDFGLARVEASSSGEMEGAKTELALTQVGAVLGTPAYMSPEQAMGETADWRSDIFSFGVILYEMVAGSRPFKGSNATAMMRQIVTKAPEPPQKFNPATPPEVVELIERCLEKDRDLRLQSMEEAVGVLRGGTGTLRTVKTAAVRAVVAEEKPKKGIPKWGYAAGVGVLVLGGIAAVPGVRKMATSASEAAFPKSAFELTNEGRELLRFYYRPGAVEKAQAAFQRALGQDANHAPAYAGTAMALFRRYTADADRTWLAQGERNARKAVELNGHLAAGQVALGYVLLELGKVEEGLKAFEAAVTMDPRNTDALRGVGAVKKRMRMQEDALAAYEKALAVNGGEWETYQHIGTLRYQMGKYAEAEKAFQKVIALTPDNHLANRNLGAMYHMQGRYDEAAAQWQKSLEINPTPTIYTNLGTTYFAQGLYQQAVQAMESGIKMGANNSLVWGNLGDAYRWTPGNEAKAKDAYLRAVQLVREALGKAPEDADLNSRLAMYLAKRGDQGEALGQLEKVEKLPRKTANVWYRMMVAYEVAGKREGALKALEGALRASYSVEEIKADPELAKMRQDARYHQVVMKGAAARGQ